MLFCARDTSMHTRQALLHTGLARSRSCQACMPERTGWTKNLPSLPAAMALKIAVPHLPSSSSPGRLPNSRPNMIAATCQLARHHCLFLRCCST